MKFFLSLILGVVVMFFIVTAQRMFNGYKLIEAEEDNKGRKRFKFQLADVLAGAGQEGWIKGAIIGTVVGAINFFAPKIKGVIWLAPIFLLILLSLMIYLIVWWKKDGSNLKEAICFIVLTVLFYLVTRPVTIMMNILIKNVFWMSVIRTLPIIMMIFAIGFFIVDALFFYYRREDVDEDKATLAHVFAWVFKILTILAIILTLVFSVRWSAINWGSNKTTPDKQATTGLSWYGFYNLNMLEDDDPTNDFNFGPNPYKESRTAQDYDKIFRNRLAKDPALGAATMAWFDANMGTRFLGVFYDEVDQKWDAAINYAKECFMKDQILYFRTLDAFFAFLDTGQVEITLATGIDDQMYMNPYTVNGIPDVIVMETDDQEGHFLTYTFTIKDKIFEVSYRIECGFQPCNVANIMKITPQERPNSTPTTPTWTPPETTPPETTPPETTPPETTPPETDPPETDPPETDPPETDPKPSNPKDPTKGTPVGPNDDPGPGPNTNNGVGAQYSTEEKPTNSAFKSYDEYKETMKELEEINETQKEAGDPNTPTVTPKPDTTVDNNADSGNGNGGIDEPTPIQEPVHVVTPDGETEPLSTDPGTAWGGPLD